MDRTKDEDGIKEKFDKEIGKESWGVGGGE
jgi:hypothetical protein